MQRTWIMIRHRRSRVIWRVAFLFASDEETASLRINARSILRESGLMLLHLGRRKELVALC